MSFLRRFLRPAGLRFASQNREDLTEVQEKYGKSPLYVTGDRGEYTNNVVMPDVNVKERFQRDNVVENYKRRMLETEIDLEKLQKRAEYLDWMREDNVRRKDMLKELGMESHKLAEEGKASEELLEEAKARVRKLKKDNKNMLQQTAEVEEKVVLDFLELPNILKCPEKDEIVYSHGEIPKFDFEPKCHMNLMSSDILPSRSAFPSLYLLGEVSKMEHELTRRLNRHLLDSNFSIISNPDTVKSVVVEGCGTPFLDPEGELALQEVHDVLRRETGQGMHLVGGASLYAFVSYFSKNVIFKPPILSKEYFTIGRRYRPKSGDDLNLFTCGQSTSCEVFHVDSFEDRSGAEIEKMLGSLKTFYDTLGVHYRLVNRAAEFLPISAASKISIEMFSAAENDFVEVGNVIDYDDYLSSRMMLKFEMEDGKGHKSMKNLKVISGTFMDVSKVIGCLIENGQDSEGTVKLSLE